ncbi:RloB family protein [Mesorhizobium sp. 10J20-29]
MARHSRARSGRDLRRKAPKRAPYPRVLIVCEGAKTEVNYFEEIRQEARLPTVNVCVLHSPLGTAPQQVVEAAEEEFLKSKGFEKVYAVFDRDEHLTYANAIAMAVARDQKLKSDEKKAVSFEACVSVPCFELWLLLHFANIMAPIHRHAALAQLQQHLIEYTKGTAGTYAATLANLEVATNRAIALKQQFSRLPGVDAYTDVHELVDTLKKLKSG